MRVFVVLLAGFAAACVGRPNVDLPIDNWDITVRETRETLEVSADVDQFTLPDADLGRVAAFAEAYIELGHGVVTVALPAGADNSASAVQAGAQVRQALAKQGVSFQQIDGAAYDARGFLEPPVLVMFTRYEAVAPDCHTRWDSYTRTARNRNTHNFGCATQANLAAMIADPRDLIQSTPAGPRDPLRGANVLDRYRAGETTATTRGGDEGVAISSAVQ